MATILLVDDEFDTLSILELLLELEGYTVSVATNVRAALVAVERDVPDLVVTDYMMPGGSGIELARNLRESERTRNVPVILNSAGQEPIKEGPRPYDCFLQKPIDFSVLLRAIKALLRRA